MSYLIDTCVISELTRPEPEPRVLQWFSKCPEEQLHISCLTLGELYFGIELLRNGRRKNDLMGWYNEFMESLKDSTVPIIDAICVRWGIERARLRRMGIQLPVIDGLIACSAIEHNYILVTRNVADYEKMDIRLLNPWQ
jgi:predicted nucleic acid-binding protein